MTFATADFSLNVLSMLFCIEKPSAVQQDLFQSSAVRQQYKQVIIGRQSAAL